MSNYTFQNSRVSAPAATSSLPHACGDGAAVQAEKRARGWAPHQQDAGQGGEVIDGAHVGGDVQRGHREEIASAQRDDLGDAACTCTTSGNPCCHLNVHARELMLTAKA